MFETTIAGSLPKPEWLAEPEKLWAPWKLEGEAVERAKEDAALLWLKELEDAGVDTTIDTSAGDDTTGDCDPSTTGGETGTETGTEAGDADSGTTSG